MKRLVLVAGGVAGRASLALVCGLAVACVATRPGGERAARSVTVEVPATDAPPVDPPRRPDGVVLEPAPAEPAPQDRVRAEGVVALREPLGGDAVATIVRALFRGFEREDAEALASLVTDDATVLGAPRGSRGQSGQTGQTGQAGQPGERSVLELWRARLRTFDYGRLAGAEVAQVDRIERFAYADLGGPGEPERPAEMQPGDLLARVPVATPRVGSEQLFGDAVVLLLRRDGRGFKIAGFGEENGP
jgi:hypothetical protein